MNQSYDDHLLIIADADALFGLNLNDGLKLERAGASVLLMVLVEPLSGSCFNSKTTTGGVLGGVEAADELTEPAREWPPSGFFFVRLRKTFIVGSLYERDVLRMIDVDEFRESSISGSSSCKLDIGDDDVGDPESKYDSCGILLIGRAGSTPAPFSSADSSAGGSSRGEGGTGSSLVGSEAGIDHRFTARGRLLDDGTGTVWGNLTWTSC